MTARRILITGGAGFIGCHLAAALVERGDRVRVLDALTSQVHGPEPRRPDHLHPDAELRVGDVRDAGAVRGALCGVDAVVHLAAAVSVGQSMYRVAHFTDVNDVGTAVLMEALMERPVEKLVVASSMGVYGEGLYRRGDALVEGRPRAAERLARGLWELGDDDAEPWVPMPTPESKAADPVSVYALSKWDQERLVLMLGRASGIPSVALRLFNVYGPHQSLSNPYTGVMAIFASRLRHGRRPLLFEDGHQRRDFVHVQDAVQAFERALDAEADEGLVVNVGSGHARSVGELARALARRLGHPELEPEVLQRHRPGDVRHCFADIEEARRRLGYAPCVSLDEGMDDLAEWVEAQEEGRDGPLVRLARRPSATPERGAA